jgi:hypothetical protein
MIQANVFLMFIVHRQGDQIGRIFAQWAIIYFGQFLKITEVAHILCCKYKGCINFVQKTVWATFWAIFIETSSGHPVRRIRS